MRSVLDHPVFDVAATPLRIALVVVLAFVLRAAAHRAINRVVRRTGSERRRQRAETLGSVLRSTASGVLYTIAGAMVLSELGLNLGPVVASAGIVGVALGFGAQNVVKDVLNGMFMILEDQYGVGDVVDMGSVIGTVEAVALRTTRLRADDGTVWHVRNGEVLRLGNSSQIWARAVLDVPVQWESNLPAVQQLLADVAEELVADEAWSGAVLEVPEVSGVESLGSDQLTVRMTVRTVPRDKDRVTRELRRRVKAALDAAPPEVGGPRGPR
ncbi:MAG TPA: mechanosensitive ion channel family protein [Mycobacteriales bacterium]|nr:mechanosensitive ion channel family protein [Mycobacteriales bacterium]